MSEKRELNAYQSVVNTISDNELYNIIANTYDEIFNMLSQHCGCYATNALLVREQSLGNFNPAIFTKDGINILDAIEYVSPIQTHLKSYIGYIGNRIDNAAHDGTTTSMMMAARMITLILEKLNYTKDDLRENTDISSEFSAVLNEMRNDLKHKKLTIEDYAAILNEDISIAQGKLAYMQSMITSKGNVALSNAMAEIFTKTPNELYSYFTFKLSDKETDKAFTVYEPQGEFFLEVVPATLEHFNHALGTEYLQENCNLIVITEELPDGYAELQVLENYIEETETPTVIIFRKANPNFIYNLPKLNKTVPIIVVNYVNRKSFSTIPIELQVINAIAGAIPISESHAPEHFVIKNVTCHIDRGQLKITNLYSYTDDNYVHPWYKDPTINGRYTKLVGDIKTHIDKLTYSHRGDNSAEITAYVGALRALIGGRLPILMIGGQTLDVRANTSVVNDVLGAITSVLEDGFVIDGNLALAHALYSSSSEGKVRDIIIECITDILAVIHCVSYMSAERIVNGYIEMMEKQYGRWYINTKSISRYNNSVEFQFTEFDELSDDTVIQPYALYDELLKRLIELIPKFINTSRIIVPNTAHVTKQDQ